jgi:hypothetical protein
MGSCERDNSFVSTRIMIFLIAFGVLALIFGVLFCCCLHFHASVQQATIDVNNSSNDDDPGNPLLLAPYPPPAQVILGDDEGVDWDTEQINPPPLPAEGEPGNPYDLLTV